MAGTQLSILRSTLAWVTVTAVLAACQSPAPPPTDPPDSDPPRYLTGDEVDFPLTLLLADASDQAYNDYIDGPKSGPILDGKFDGTEPAGYDYVGRWLGVDKWLWGEEATPERFGVVFRSEQSPHTYIFAFRGTTSYLDMYEDLFAVAHSRWSPPSGSSMPSGSCSEPKVADGLWSVYTAATDSVASMRAQVLSLYEQYAQSDKPIHRLLVTGHSLGASTGAYFAYDLMAVRDQTLALIDFASPRNGDSCFASLYQEQVTRTVSSAIRVQNWKDFIPCLPPSALGFQHTYPAYLIDFDKRHALVPHVTVRHSLLNYTAVLECAETACQDRSQTCYCAGEVQGDGVELSSGRPDTATVCDLIAGVP